VELYDKKGWLQARACYPPIEAPEPTSVELAEEGEG
jgi:hypothetical protein